MFTQGNLGFVCEEERGGGRVGCSCGEIPTILYRNLWRQPALRPRSRPLFSLASVQNSCPAPTPLTETVSGADGTLAKVR